MASSLGGPGMTSGVPPPRIVNLEFPPPPPYPPPHNQVNLEMRIINFAMMIFHRLMRLIERATMSEANEKIYPRIFFKHRNAV